MIRNKTGHVFLSLGRVIFNGSQLLAAHFLFHIAEDWPKINEEFAQMEFKFNKYGYPKRIKLKFQVITIFYMAIGCGK